MKGPTGVMRAARSRFFARQEIVAYLALKTSTWG
jgi:hypothetical protein